MFRMQRKAEESRMGFNKRSASQLHHWFQQANLQMAYHRVLKMVFKAAWKEKSSPCALGQNPLQWARECRDSSWWNLVRAECSRREMRQEKLEHRRAVHGQTSWEDVFVTVYGPAWRAVRDEHASMAQWMSKAPSFIDTVCERWGLPLVRAAAPAHCAQVPTTIRVTTSVEQYPELVPHACDHKWQPGGIRLWIQVDCKAVAELCAGRAVLSTPELRPLFVRVCRSLHFLSSMGCRPLNNDSDMVLWSPREFNTVGHGHENIFHTGR